MSCLKNTSCHSQSINVKHSNGFPFFEFLHWSNSKLTPINCAGKLWCKRIMNENLDWHLKTATSESWGGSLCVWKAKFWSHKPRNFLMVMKVLKSKKWPKEWSYQWKYHILEKWEKKNNFSFGILAPKKTFLDKLY